MLRRIHSRANGPESLVRTHEGVACKKVSGPPSLESDTTIHREVLTIPLDPPGNGPDVTQINFPRQYKSKNFYRTGRDSRSKKLKNPIFFTSIIQNNNFRNVRTSLRSQ